MTHEVTIEAPGGSKFLIVGFPKDQELHLLEDQVRQVEELIRRASDTDTWPVVLAVPEDVSIRWLETEVAP